MRPRISRTIVPLAVILTVFFFQQTTISPAEQNTNSKAASAVPPHEARNMARVDANEADMEFIPGKGLAVRSANRDFALITRLRAQMLYDYNYQHDDAAGPQPDSMNFQIRRARLAFTGNYFGPHNSFKTEFAFSSRDNDRADPGTGTDVARQNALLVWYMDFTYLRDANLRIGQYKIPYSRQRVVSSGNLQFVDRSMTGREFTLDFDQGAHLFSKNLAGLDMFRYYAGIYIGEGRNTSDNTVGAGDTSPMYLGRVEVLPLGMFQDYSEADFARSSKPRISIGLAGAYLQDSPRSQGIIGDPIQTGIDSTHYNADILFMMSGLSVFVDFFVREFIDHAEMANGWGMNAQAGYLLPATSFEISCRFSMNRAAADSSLTDANESGPAFSYYFARHVFKLQADIMRIWNPGRFGQGEDRLRIQLQAGF
jgi:phosphate-selective porin OprO/OprP